MFLSNVFSKQKDPLIGLLVCFCCYYFFLFSPTTRLHVAYTCSSAELQFMNILQLKNHSLKIPDITYLATVWLEMLYIYVLFSPLFPTLHLPCCSHQELHTEAGFNDPVLLRKKRMAQVEKNTCQLFIQTDHLFYKYYKTREAVIAQVKHSHRHSIDTSYHGAVYTVYYTVSMYVCLMLVERHSNIKSIKAN